MIIQLQEAADFLTNPKKRLWLNPFFFQEVTQKDVAECFGITLGAVDHRIKKLLAMELIEVTREEVIDGHRTKFYRITSQEFLVPIEATSSVDLATYRKRIAIDKAEFISKGLAYGMHKQTEYWGFRIGCVDKMGVYQTIVGKDFQGNYKSSKELPNYGKYFASDAGLSLSDTDAKELHDELRHLYNKYRKKSHESDDKQKFYFLDLSFVPTGY